MPSEVLLNENECVHAVAQYLKQEGYTVSRAASTTQKGIDIEATSPSGEGLFVEVKGATSAKETSSRHGSPFSQQQVKGHVAKAIWKAMQMRQRGSGRVAIAFPQNKYHIEFVEQVSESLRALEIDVFWVKNDTEVERELFRSK